MSLPLFTFSTTRNPKAMSQVERRRFHVLMRDDDRSRTHYWSDLARGDSRILLNVIRGRASSAANAPEILRLDQLSDRFREYLELYRDAHSEARRRSFTGTIDMINDNGPSPLQGEDRVLLWDMLAHHLWVAPNKAIVDTIRSIFVASQLIEVVRLFEDSDDEAENENVARRASHGRVVLPLQIDNQRRQSPRADLSDQQQDMLETAHDRILDNAEIDDLETARTEINTLAIEASAAARRETEDDRAGIEDRLVSSLSATLSASALESILPTLRSNLVTAVEPQRVDFPRIVAERATPLTARLLERHTPAFGALSSLAAINDLEAEIEDRETGLVDEITNVHQSTFLAFGAEIAIEVFIPKGLAIFKVMRAPESGFHVYMTYHRGRDLPPIAEIGGDITAGGTRHDVDEQEVNQGNSKFQTFRLTETPIISSRFDLDLTFMSAEADSSPVSLDVFRLYSNSPRFRMLDLDPFDTEGVPPKPIFGVNRLGIIDYRRVEQELSCYVTGEVSRIENIMASEFKERVSRNLSRIETEQQETQEVASEHMSESSTAERLEMQSQVSSVLKEQSGFSFDTGVKVHTKFPGGTLDTNADFNYNTQTSREESTSEAIKAAKDITRKVQDKLLQKATSSRRSMSLRENEYITKSGYDNRQNPDHVVGVSRWVDKVMTNRLVNYGQLNVLEFDVPEPARNFIRAQETVQEKDSILPKRPKRPRKIGLRGANSINRRNWRRFAAAYRVDIDPPPPRIINIARSYADSELLSSDDGPSINLSRQIAYNDIEIPSDYRAIKYWVTRSIGNSNAEPGDFGSGGSFEGGSNLFVSVGGGSFNLTLPSDEPGTPLPAIAGPLAVAISCHKVQDFSVAIRVRCKLRSGIFRAWQMDTHAILMSAYRKMRDAYREAREAHLAEDEENDLNPRFKKRHMERELKRVCIDMLTAPFDVDVTADHYDAAPDGEFHKLRQGSELDKHAETVRFFEHAFWWEIMSYGFYPYFYADRQSWSVKLTMEATRNALFSSFLSSGMGRVMLPIRPGFEEAVMYYMQTGEVWFGKGFVVDSENDLYLSIADEISQRRDIDEVIEDTWQTRLPTHHTILQSAAAAMIGEGLPCENVEDRIGVGTSTLSPVLPVVAADN